MSSSLTSEPAKKDNLSKSECKLSSPILGRDLPPKRASMLINEKNMSGNSFISTFLDMRSTLASNKHLISSIAPNTIKNTRATLLQVFYYTNKHRFINQ
jgi:hypothetical protein